MPKKRRDDKTVWDEFDDEADFDSSDIKISWIDYVLDIIIVLAVILIVIIMMSLASKAAPAKTPTIPVAGVNRQLMIIQNVAEIRGEKLYQEHLEKKRKKQNLKMAYEGFLIMAFGYLPSDNEIELIKMVCMAEGGNTESIDGLVAIFAVIRNRVLDPRFPDTIEEVCMQRLKGKDGKWHYQFETVATGAIYKHKINDRVEEAWDSFLEGAYMDYSGICFFTAGGYNPYCKPAYKIGRHYFGY